MVKFYSSISVKSVQTIDSLFFNYLLIILNYSVWLRGSQAGGWYNVVIPLQKYSNKNLLMWILHFYLLTFPRCARPWWTPCHIFPTVILRGLMKTSGSWIWTKTLWWFPAVLVCLLHFSGAHVLVNSILAGTINICALGKWIRISW